MAENPAATHRLPPDLDTIDPALRQLALRTLLAAFPGTGPPDWAEQLLTDGLAGYTLFGRNVVNPPQLAALTNQLRTARPEVLIAIDEEGGDVTRLAHRTGSPYPGNAALGVVGDPTLTQQVYRAIGGELAGVGINLNLAPTVDVNTADDNPIIGTRSFGADPTAVAAHTTAAVTGLQHAAVAACAKHFPGHGATITDSHLTLPIVSAPATVLRTRDLPPFAAAIEAGTKAIMTAHIRVPALTGDDPATFSTAALVDLLRHEYQFTGVVITDALEMAGATATTAGGMPAAAVRALAAGADLLCIGADVDAALVERIAAAVADALASDELSTSRVEQAAARVDDLSRWALSHGDLSHGAGNPAAAEPPPADLGYQIAQQAVIVEGTTAGLTDLFIIELAAGPTIAEGQVPWGLAPHLPGVLRIDTGQTSPEQLRQLAGGRAAVLVGRHLHRDPATRAWVEAFTGAHPTIVAELGWPSGWRPAGARAFITTHGASYANGAALADVLRRPPAGGPPAVS